MEEDELIVGCYYLYPQNGHNYRMEGVVRCKDRSTGEWYDAVMYVDGDDCYVREKEDFMKKFRIIS